MGFAVWETERLVRELADPVRLAIGIGIGAIVYAALLFILAPAKVRLIFMLVPSWRHR
jgi:hypothetical protein